MTCFWHQFNSYFSFIHLFLPKFSFFVLFMNTKFYVKNTKRLFVEGISLILIFVISLHFSWPPLYSYFPFIYLLHSPSLLKKQVHLGVTHAGHESSKKKKVQALCLGDVSWLMILYVHAYTCTHTHTHTHTHTCTQALGELCHVDSRHYIYTQTHTHTHTHRH